MRSAPGYDAGVMQMLAASSLRTIRLAAVLSSLLLAAPAPAQDVAARVTAAVGAITAGDDGAARREAIVTQLRAAGAEAVLEPFGEGAAAGTNIVVTFPGSGPRTIVVGAHYDRVTVGRGAVDNAGSCAALLELVASFKASPPGRATVQLVFFDREEAGLLGSRAYFAVAGRRADYALNLDIFAYGDTLFATASQPDGVLLRTLRAAAAAAGLPVRDVPRASYPGSDHLTMMQAGIETVGLALVDGADVDGVLGAGVKNLVPGKGPRILTIIHTANDTAAEVRPAQVARGVAMLEQLVRAAARD